MEITTAFAPGDKAWAWIDEQVQEVTIGQVRVSITQSPGIPGHWADNYAAKEGREEQYMCVETGVCSGSLYTLNEHIFATRSECETAFAAVIAKREEEKARRIVEERRRMLAEEDDLRRRLARIEAMKSGA